MSEVITAINAKPETIKVFLGNYDYVIPDYQRPYSWGKDECVRLWEDLINYFEETNDPDPGSPYFLGNIVIYNEDKKRCIVDGQQRLITLNLLILALLKHCQTFTILERILYKVDPITGEIIKPFQIKIEHLVLGNNENQKLIDALLTQVEESNYLENYKLFFEKIEEYFKDNKCDAEQVKKIVLSLIENVVVLPIECTDFESALTIFETINNRGMDLSDSDIFKSKLYKYSQDKKDEFIIRWNDLVSNVAESGLELKDVFSNYMHVIRGKEKNVDSIVGLRKFYDQNSGIRLKRWNDVLNSLEILTWGWNYMTNKNSEASNEILNWFNVLDKYPNSYWQYPVMTFIHENTSKEGEEYIFNKESELLELLRVTACYCYWKWLKYRGVNAIKDTIYKVVREVANNGDYKAIYKENILADISGDTTGKGMQNTVKGYLNGDLGKGLSGVCLLAATLNPEQNRKMPLDFHIEHILPQKWDHYKYTGWDVNSYNLYKEKLGNLTILEKKLNIKASHRFFAEKKNYYNRSEIVDARELGSLRDWTPTEYKERNTKITDRLSTFISDLKIYAP